MLILILLIVGNFLNPDSSDAKHVNLTSSIIAPTTKPSKPKAISKKAATTTKSTYVVEDIDDYEEDDDEDEEDGNVDTSRNFNNEDHIEYFDDHEDNDYDDDYDDWIILILNLFMCRLHLFRNKITFY